MSRRAEQAAERSEGAAEEAEEAADRAEDAAEEAEEAVDSLDAQVMDPEQDLGEPGPPLPRHTPFYIGFFGGLGAILAVFLGQQLLAVGNYLVLIVVAMFLAAGLNPAVEFFMRRGLARSWSVLVVIASVLGVLALFVVAIVPVISDQVAAISTNAPDWLDQLQSNKLVQDLDDQFGILDKVRDYVAKGDFASGIFGGVLGFGLKVLSALTSTFIIIVLMLYFLSSLHTTKDALYRLAPASRRDRVSKLGDQVIKTVGGYVSGAFIVAMCAGVSSLIVLFVVGLGKYAVALAFVVTLLDVIPMIGATIGAVIVTAIGFATDPHIGIVCAIFYLLYQQLENYVIYPRVMSRAVEIPGSVTVIAALIGAGLLGVVGALLAIPTAAAILMLTREVFVRRQDRR